MTHSIKACEADIVMNINFHQINYLNQKLTKIHKLLVLGRKQSVDGQLDNPNLPRSSSIRKMAGNSRPP